MDEENDLLYFNRGTIYDQEGDMTNAEKNVGVGTFALGALTTSITSGSIDNIESYKYNVGQIKAYEAILQEISNLLEKKEQYEKNTGRVIDIKTQPKY